MIHNLTCLRTRLSIVISMWCAEDDSSISDSLCGLGYHCLNCWQHCVTMINCRLTILSYCARLFDMSPNLIFLAASPNLRPHELISWSPVLAPRGYPTGQTVQYQNQNAEISHSEVFSPQSSRSGIHTVMCVLCSHVLGHCRLKNDLPKLDRSAKLIIVTIWEWYLFFMNGYWHLNKHNEISLIIIIRLMYTIQKI